MSSDDSHSGIISDISSIGRGAFIFIFGMGFQSLLGFVVNLILTRLLGASLYGTYSYSKTILSLGKVFGDVGSSEAVIRFLPEFDEEERSGIFSIAFFSSLFASFVIVLMVYLFAPSINSYTLGNDVFVPSFRMFLGLLIPAVLLALICNTFRAIESPFYQIGIRKVMYPGLRLLAVIISAFLGYSLFGIVVSLVVAAFLTFGISMYILFKKTNIRIKATSGGMNLKEYYNYSLPMVFTHAGSLLYTRLDILMIGYFLSDVDVGIYNIAILVATFTGMPLSGLNQIFPPIASRLHSDSRYEELQRVFSTITRWAFTLALFGSLSVAVFRTEILLLFGEEFLMGETVLILFLISQLIRNAVGPSGYLLMMTDHQYLVMFNRWLLGISNVFLNYFLILKVGFVGAALGSALSLALVNIIRIVEIYILEGYWPYSMSFIKPIISGIVSLCVMWLIGFIFSGVLLLAIGGLIGAVSFLACLYLLGPESTDREVLEYVKNT